MNCEEFAKLGRKLKGIALELYAGNGDYEDDFEMLININNIIDDMFMAFEDVRNDNKILEDKKCKLYFENIRLKRELEELKGEAKES